MDSWPCRLNWCGSPALELNGSASGCLWISSFSGAGERPAVAISTPGEALLSDPCGGCGDSRGAEDNLSCDIPTTRTVTYACRATSIVHIVHTLFLQILASASDDRYL